MYHIKALIVYDKPNKLYWSKRGKKQTVISYMCHFIKKTIIYFKKKLLALYFF